MPVLVNERKRKHLVRAILPVDLFFPENLSVLMFKPGK